MHRRQPNGRDVSKVLHIPFYDESPELTKINRCSSH
jgi:hypothetical protein